MFRLVQKSLSILLILLLGLSPLQTVLADLSVPVDQTNMPCHMSANSTDNVQIPTQLTANCEMCNTTDDCGGSSCCSYSQCSSHFVALLQDFSASDSNVSSFKNIQAGTNLALQQLTALFRPPRA